MKLFISIFALLGLLNLIIESKENCISDVDYNRIYNFIANDSSIKNDVIGLIKSYNTDTNKYIFVLRDTILPDDHIHINDHLVNDLIKNDSNYKQKYIDTFVTDYKKPLFSNIRYKKIYFEIDDDIEQMSCKDTVAIKGLPNIWENYMKKKNIITIDLTSNYHNYIEAEIYVIKNINSTIDDKSYYYQYFNPEWNALSGKSLKILMKIVGRKIILLDKALLIH